MGIFWDFSLFVRPSVLYTKTSYMFSLLLVGTYLIKISIFSILPTFQHIFVKQTLTCVILSYIINPVAFNLGNPLVRETTSQNQNVVEMYF